ncbi:IclR family transcriptional regulator [Xenophilus arseniciresistens]|uniref:IclR family transcriptional regulator n=1 Tax=Xenophilus arseniciresistens TaxID=1283306 RepID=A0AAE3ND25_9BURK|nr:IclR family transcriptional regulator [Xenophilus arseniciresistens]MDA7418601.1 IclR family transcriptional regulator [Xenophilus arseniciresistens]
MPSNAPAPSPAAGPRVRPVPAVSRALAILRLLGQHKEALTLKAISQELALVTSTCLHILRVLVEEGMVRVDPATKRYSLDVGVLALAHSVVQNNPFTTLVQPVLDRLSETWNVTTIGIKVTGVEDLVVLALARSRAPFRLYVEVGSRFPALTSATGRLVAAYGGMSNAELARAFKALRWDDAPDFQSWQQEVKTVQQRGVAIDRGNYMSGIAVVAVPILDGAQRITHALTAVGVADQLSKTQIQALAKDLQREAQALSQRISGRD